MWTFREPIERGTTEYDRAVAAMKRLAGLLGGDPNPTHPAALLRVPGTLNSKYDGDPVLVATIGGSGQAVDLADIEEMIELLEQRGKPLLTLKPPVRLNGKDAAPETGYAQPLNVEQCLASMYWNGPGSNNNIHQVQLRVTGSLTWRGEMVADTVPRVLEATRRAIAHDPSTAGWNWTEEEADVTRMCTDAINDRPELIYTLPDAVREEFADILAEGRQPLLQVSKLAKIFIKRSRGPNAKLGEETRKDPGDAGAGPQNSRRGPAIEAKPFVRFDPAKLPPREWVYGRRYQKGVATCTVGAGGGGKSSADLVELMAMCTGRPLLGEQPLARCRVWYHNAEDDQDEIYRRIAAVCQCYKIPQEDLEGWLFVTSGLEMPIKIAASKNGGVVIDAAASAAIVRTITDNEICVASFDPLIAHHATLENATGDMDQVAREFACIANITNCAVEIVHHTRKPAPGQEELSVLDSRGAVSLINAVRSARVLNTMTKAEADKAGIDDIDRRLYFRIDRGKANMAPPTAAHWFRFVSVDLPNGDNVGVVTMWASPDQGPSPWQSEVDKKVEDVFMALLARLTQEGRKVSPSAGHNYAPNIFSKEREAKASKISKNALAEAMRRLFEAKRIRVEQYGEGKHAFQLIVPT